MKTCRQPEGISLQQITGNKELDIENKVSRTSQENLKQAQIIEGPPFPKYIPYFTSCLSAKKKLSCAIKNQ